MLYLQRASLDHAPIWFALLEDNRSHLEPWMPHLQEIRSVEDAQAYIQKYTRLDIYMGFHIYELWTEAGELVGLITLHGGRLTQKSAELGYWLGSAFTGKGYTTTACYHLISLAFAQHDLERIQIRCLAQNIPSRKVARRLGMTLLSQVGDEVLFEITKENWDQDENYWLWFLEAEL